LPRYRVHDDLPVLMMDYLAPRTGRSFRAREWVEGVLIDVIAARTMVAGECLKSLDRVNEIAEVRALGDAVNVSHGVTGTSNPRILIRRCGLPPA